MPTFTGLDGRKPICSMAWIRLPDAVVGVWLTSAVNPWGFAMEKMTQDGRYRHRTFDDNLEPMPWIDGPHPIAQALRDQGKEQTDGFDMLNRDDRQHA